MLARKYLFVFLVTLLSTPSSFSTASSTADDYLKWGSVIPFTETNFLIKKNRRRHRPPS